MGKSFERMYTVEEDHPLVQLPPALQAQHGDGIDDDSQYGDGEHAPGFHLLGAEQPGDGPRENENRTEQKHRCTDERAQQRVPLVPEGELIGPSPLRQLFQAPGNHERDRIAEIVHRIRKNGDAVREKPPRYFNDGEKEVEDEGGAQVPAAAGRVRVDVFCRSHVLKTIMVLRNVVSKFS